jgi:hypothetical protein
MQIALGHEPRGDILDRTGWQQTDGEIWHATPGLPTVRIAPRRAQARRAPARLVVPRCGVLHLAARPARSRGRGGGGVPRTGLCARATFLRPEKDPASVRIGIWQSHRRVAEHALSHGRATVLICEDDLMFARRIAPDAVRAVGEAMRALPRDWMMLYLGHWPLWGYFVRSNVLRCGSVCCHAYIASERMLRWLRDHPPDSVPIARNARRGVDAAFARLAATYAMFPMLAIQRPGRSDNMALATDAGRRSSST